MTWIRSLGQDALASPSKCVLALDAVSLSWMCGYNCSGVDVDSNQPLAVGSVGAAWSAYHTYTLPSNPKTSGTYTTMRNAQSAASSQLTSAGVVALLGNSGSQTAMQLLSQQAASLASATSSLYSNSSSPQVSQQPPTLSDAGTPWLSTCTSVNEV